MDTKSIAEKRIVKLKVGPHLQLGRSEEMLDLIGSCIRV